MSADKSQESKTNGDGQHVEYDRGELMEDVNCDDFGQRVQVTSSVIQKGRVKDEAQSLTTESYIRKCFGQSATAARLSFKAVVCMFL